MPSTAQIKRDRVLQVIDQLTAPPVSKRAALDVLEQVILECECRAEALKEEIKNDA